MREKARVEKLTYLHANFSKIKFVSVPVHCKPVQKFIHQSKNGGKKKFSMTYVRMVGQKRTENDGKINRDRAFIFTVHFVLVHLVCACSLYTDPIKDFTSFASSLSAKSETIHK